MKFKGLGLRISKRVVKTVGSWWFVLSYALALLTWVAAHKLGILHIDSAEFSLTALCIEMFAGIQASIILMYEHHQAEGDRRRAEATHKLTKHSAGQIAEIYKDISMIEDLLEDLTQETTDEKT